MGVDHQGNYNEVDVSVLDCQGILFERLTHLLTNCPQQDADGMTDLSLGTIIVP
jgi:hypothetical protein